MASITSAGVGSGLDIDNIIKQLVKLERRPLDRVDQKQAQVNAQISAYGSLKSKIDAFRNVTQELGNISSFKAFKGSSSNEDVLTASVNSDANAGSYKINVQQLAERDKFAFGPYADGNEALGSGTLTLSVGAESFAVSVGENATLKDVRNAINSSADNTGISAALVTSDDGTRLVLSSDKTGADNAVSVSVSADSDGNDSDNAGLSALTRVAGGADFSTAISTAKDSVVEIDGFTVSSSSNTVSDAIDGATFTLKKVGESSLEINRDDEKILESVNKFVDAYNGLRSEIKKQRSGHLEADSSLLSIERGLSNAFNSGGEITGSSFRYLVEAGVSVNKNGVIEVDEDAVTKALNTDFNSFVNLFSAKDEGYANRLEKLADGWLEQDGLIDSRQDGLKQRLDRLEDDEFRLEARIDLVERRLRTQFAALDSLVGKLSNTGDYLQQQLGALR